MIIPKKNDMNSVWNNVKHACVNITISFIVASMLKC